MKRVRFRDPAGSTRMGEWHGDSVSAGGREYDLGAVDVLPPSDPSKLLGVPANHTTNHESEADYPDRPMLFVKPPNTLSGHGDTVTIPVEDQHIIYEGELGLVVGEQCRNVPAEDAMDVVAGFTCMNDITWGDEEGPRVKVFDNAMPAGPTLVPPEEVPEDAHIETRINGEVGQEGPRSDLIFSVPEIIEDLSQHITLEAGDMIATGTPQGGDRLRDGDHVEIEIEGIGTLEHDVRHG